MIKLALSMPQFCYVPVAYAFIPFAKLGVPAFHLPLVKQPVSTPGYSVKETGVPGLHSVSPRDFFLGINLEITARKRVDHNSTAVLISLQETTGDQSTSASSA